MAVVVNNPSSTQPVRESSTGWIVGLIVLLLLAFLVVYYGLPALRGAASNNVNVPGRIDVNVNTPNSVNPQ